MGDGNSPGAPFEEMAWGLRCVLVLVTSYKPVDRQTLGDVPVMLFIKVCESV